MADDGVNPEHEARLRGYCRQLRVVTLSRKLARLRSLPMLLTRRPLTLSYFHSAELARAIQTALRQRSYDRIVVYCSAMSQYVEGCEGIPIITDFVDVDSDKWVQYASHTRFPYSLIYQREGRTLREYERHVCERSSRILVTTGREARLVRQIAGATPVEVIPNGVDGEYFKPAAAGSSAVGPTIGFTGDMSYFPNQEAVTCFAREILPLIRRTRPDARFLIVGRNPGRSVQKLREIEGVEVTGFVADVRPFLARMQVSVAPFSIAAGIQNKILEAMACGIPVVATSRAVQGLSSKAAAAVGVADTPGDMAAQILQLLSDSRLARTKGLDARERVLEEYNWDRALGQFLQLLESEGVEESPVIAHSPMP